MRLSDYIWDRINSILINTAGMILLSGYLYITGYSGTGIILIVCVWLGILLCWIAVNYYNRNKYYNHIEKVIGELDKKYLIAEVIKPSIHIEDKIYRDILKKSNKSVIEEISELESREEDYREFIEAWIHDVKTPLTAVSLICQNMKETSYETDMSKDSQNILSDNTSADDIDKIQSELAKIENKVNIVLYYARMENTSNDYAIHKAELKKIVIKAIQHNRTYFIRNHMNINIDINDVVISTDEKWLEFILDQVFINAIKYKKDSGGNINVYSRKMDKCINLYIEDDGIGIPEQDIRRVFDKGFTGSNGRIDENQYSEKYTGAFQGSRKSTGLGLYLCKKLCDKLSIGIYCESVQYEYTRIILSLPDSDFSKIK